MKKILLVLVLIIVLSSCGNIDQSPLGPKAKNNEEVMEYVQTLKEDFPLISARLETLRRGEVGQGKYSMHEANRPDAPEHVGDIYIYQKIDTKDDLLLLSENPYNLPDNEIEAIDYLFYSDKLRLNVRNADYGEPSWNRAIGSQGAMFAEVGNGSFNIGIFYFENNEVPEELQNSKDYVEELSDNYWIVACNMQRP